MDGNAWLRDLNADGKADLLYLRRNRQEYWAKLSKGNEGEKDEWVTSRSPDYDVFEKNRWVADLTGDGKPELLYLRRDTNEYRALELVMPKKDAVAASPVP